MEKRINKRKVLTGFVISDKMIKTRVVEIRSHGRHPKYDKLMIHYARYKAHDEKNEAHVGDLVEITQSRPLSKDKRWVISSVVEKNTNKEAVVL